MSDQNIRPIQSKAEPSKLQQGAVKQVQGGQASVPVSNSTNDSVVVSVPNTQPKNLEPGDPDSALKAILGGELTAQGLAAAHSGLDPARVFKLLEDD